MDNARGGARDKITFADSDNRFSPPENFYKILHSHVSRVIAEIWKRFFTFFAYVSVRDTLQKNLADFTTNLSKPPFFCLLDML